MRLNKPITLESMYVSHILIMYEKNQKCVHYVQKKSESTGHFMGILKKNPGLLVPFSSLMILSFKNVFVFLKIFM